MSYVSLIMMLAPLLAPSLGSLILEFGEWPLIFISQSCYAITLLLLVIFKLKMPSDKAKDTRSTQSFLKSYKTVLTRQGGQNQHHLWCTDILCFLLLFYPLRLSFNMEVFNLDKSLFAILFSTNVGALMLANIVNSRIVGRYGSNRMLYVATVFATLSATGLLIVNLIDLSYHYTVAMLIPLMGCLGVMSVNADAIVLMKFKKETGTATAVIGTLRFGFGLISRAFIGIILYRYCRPLFCNDAAILHDGYGLSTISANSAKSLTSSYKHIIECFITEGPLS